MSQLFFLISKIGWSIFCPDILLVLLLLIGLILFRIKAYRKSLRLFTLLMVSIIAITLFPLGDWLLYPLEKRFPPQRQLPESVNGIIVLGGAEKIYTSFSWQQVELNAAAERFFAFIALAKKYPEAKLIYTGGTGSITHQELKGSAVAKKLFIEQGLDVSKIIFESQSKNTFENAVFTYKLIAPKPAEKWILITTAAHMPRSYGVFSKAGWKNILPYVVDHETNPKTLFRLTLNFSGNLSRLNSAAQEWLGLIVYYLTGKTHHIFPKPINPQGSG